MCGCTKNKRVKFLWTSADGSTSQTYSTEAAANAKVKRKGGSWVKVTR